MSCSTGLRVVLSAGLFFVLAAPSSFASLIAVTGSAADAAGITAVRDTFRTNLGGGTTAGANGLFDDGTSQRREINWDGVPAAMSAPNNLNSNFFNVNSPRGVVFTTPGTAFQVSGASGDAGAGQPAAANFGNIDATYASTFSPFSPQRLFTVLGSNVMDVTFFVPGTATPGATKGFGVIFSDVDVAGTTALQFFDINGVSLGTFSALSQPSGFSFLGAYFNDGSTPIARVRITLGNTALGAGVTDNGTTRDLVVMDDFLYGNPVAASAVPEPATLGSLSLALITLAMLRKRRT